VRPLYKKDFGFGQEFSVALEQARELVAEEVPTPAKKRKRKP